MADQGASSRDSLRRAVELALPLARERAQLLGEITELLRQGSDREAVTLMRRYCGLSSMKVAS